jgi:hypothetical protein
MLIGLMTAICRASLWLARRPMRGVGWGGIGSGDCAAGRRTRERSITSDRRIRMSRREPM